MKSNKSKISNEEASEFLRRQGVDPEKSVWKVIPDNITQELIPLFLNQTFGDIHVRVLQLTKGEAIYGHIACPADKIVKLKKVA